MIRPISEIGEYGRASYSKVIESCPDKSATGGKTNSLMTESAKPM